jgi:hypothetical protein
MRLVMKLSDSTTFWAPGVRSHPVSSRVKNTKTRVATTRPTDHQYSIVHEWLAAMKPENVGPAEAPKFSAKCRTVKARPRW